MKMTSREWEYSTYIQNTFDEFGEIKKLTGFTLGEMFMMVDNVKFADQVEKYHKEQNTLRVD